MYNLDRPDPTYLILIVPPFLSPPAQSTVPTVETQKLTSEHIQHLIELYKAQPNLWNQSHPEFRNVELGRESWRHITDAWSAYCGRAISMTDVRIRISTLCQRFIKQRERMAAEGELEAKFVHYDQLKFLCEQQSLLKRQEHVTRENRKLVEIYEHYPILWHNAHKRLRCVDTMRKRNEAHRGLQLALRMCGIRLSGLAIQRRLQSLRKRYRLEKIRYLQSVVEGKQAQFEPGFEHYAEMEFLHKHIDPYVCAACGKIFDNLVSHQAHVQSSCEAQLMSAEQTMEAMGAEATVGELMVQQEQLDLGVMGEQGEEEVEEGEEEQQAEEEKEQEHEQLEEQREIEEKEEELQQEQEKQEEQLEQELEEEEQLQEQAGAVQLLLQQTQQVLPMPPAQLEMPTLLHPELDEEIATLPLHTALAALPSEPATVQEEQHYASSYSSSAEDSPPLTGLLPHQRVRLTLLQTLKLIELYQAQPNLWDPNNLDYHSRKHRRDSWHQITAELNGYAGASYTWKMLHRKLTDYTKYYRRERQREALAEEGEGEGTRWNYYEAFSFLDDVLPMSCVLQKTLQQRDSNLKIIQVYQSYEQLWNTFHPDYTKRKQRQRQLESLCTRLQEECNLQITVERLKNRLIEFRCQYRQCKEARQAAQKRGEMWTSSYEYYEQLRFLELHVSPFCCPHCPNSFKRRTDYLRHQRNVHLDELEKEEPGQQLRKRRARRGAAGAPANPLEHICHICAMKFSLRTSLLAHLRRHLGQRTHACSECPKKFFNSTSLRVHMRSHTKELPYVCEHCARGFVNASKLNQHVKRHQGKRDYPCSRCEKAFFTGHERDRHMRAHLNIRDKVCPYCGRAFVVGSAYYAHLNLHRGEKRYTCVTCGQKFAQYAGLYKHRKRCVPGEK